MASDVRGLAWHIECDDQLQVTIAVIANRILLLSDDRVAEQEWRIGSYMDEADAARRAVDMTSSYERLRHGVIGAYAEVSVPEPAWKATIANDDAVDTRVIKSITDALVLSSILSPEEG